MPLFNILYLCGDCATRGGTLTVVVGVIGKHGELGIRRLDLARKLRSVGCEAAPLHLDHIPPKTNLCHARDALSERWRRLQGILPERSGVISPALSVQGRGWALFELMCEHDLEGMVAKKLTDAYEPRSKWLKIKNPDYSQKEGRWELFNSR